MGDDKFGAFLKSALKTKKNKKDRFNQTHNVGTHVYDSDSHNDPDDEFGERKPSS